MKWKPFAWDSRQSRPKRADSPGNGIRRFSPSNAMNILKGLCSYPQIRSAASQLFAESRCILMRIDVS